jgi:hypothetical protein
MGVNVEFEIDDAVFNEQDQLPKVVKEIITITEKLPDGKLITTRKLGQLLNRAVNYINSHSAHPGLDKYRITFQRKNIYGNEATVRAFKEKNI